MKILNNSEKFQLTFDGHDVIVPQGLSAEFSDKIAYHIQDVAIRWGKNIRLIGTLEEEQKAKEQLAQKIEQPVEQPKKDFPEEKSK